MPKVSVIVPTYNVESYLRQAMDSVINQTLEDIEIICIDDGSTDNSGKILDEYAAKDNRVKVIHKENGGYGKAMNVGLDNATGEYIGIVEPDDFIAPNMYEELYSLAKENNLEFVKADFYRYSTSPEIKNSYFSPCIKTDIYNKIIKPLDHINVFNGSLSIWAALYNRNFLVDKDIKFLETPGASFQDTSFGLKILFEAQRALFIDKAFYYYRIDNVNSSVKNNSKIFCICDEIHELEKRYESSSQKIKKMINTLKIDKYTWNYNRLAKAGRKDFFKVYKKELRNIIRNEDYIKNFIPQDIITNAINILNIKLKNEKTVLIVEDNISHAECLPTYINYFLQLGYKIDVLMNKLIEKEQPLEMFKNNQFVSIKYAKEQDIISILNSDDIKNYSYCFINSDMNYSRNCTIFKLIKKVYFKTKYINVVHRLENLEKIKKRAFPIVLKSFNKNTKDYEVNPCYFGDVQKHSKNTLINFVVAGNIESYRKNYNILIDSVEKLVSNNITNFKITIIGKGNILDIPDKIKHFFDIKGRLSYADMYKEMQNADYFLTLLDPDDKDHERYITMGTSGSFQLINGFNVPCLIANKFAIVHGYNTENSIIYDNNINLYDAMVNAIQLSEEKYQKIKSNLKTLSDQIYKSSFDNFQKLLNSKPRYLFSMQSIYLIFMGFLKNIFSVSNNLTKSHKIITLFGFKIKIKKEYLKRILFFGNKQSKGNKWYKIINVLGIKFSFRNKKKEEKLRQEQLFNNVNTCLQRTNACLRKIDSCQERTNTCLQKIDSCRQKIDKISSDNKKYYDELIYANIFNNLINNIKWIDTKDFIPTMGAANYSLLFILINILNMVQPKNILELGIGQTSKLTCAYAKYFKDTKLKIIEHDNAWINKMSEQLQPSDNTQIANKRMIKVNYNNTKNDAYENLTDVVQDTKFNLILIDGPYGYNSVYPRMNVLDLLPQNLAEDFVIILDDVERKGEQNTKNLILKKLDDLGIKYTYQVKGSWKSQLVITSQNLSWIFNY